MFVANKSCFLKKRQSHSVYNSFEAVLRIQNKSFGSGFGSGSGLKLVSDTDPDSNLGVESRSESWILIWIRNWPKIHFFILKFLPSLIFKHKKPAFSQLHDFLRNKFAGFGFGSISKRHGSADPDPYQKVTDPQHWLIAS
jgi:hypothetical protein